EPAVLLREGPVRPARRADQRHAPRRILEEARGRAADLEAARRAWRGRRDLVLALARDGRARLHQLAAVAIDVERDDRIGEAETLLLVVEIDHRVIEGMRQP